MCRWKAAWRRATTRATFAFALGTRSPTENTAQGRTLCRCDCNVPPNNHKHHNRQQPSNQEQPHQPTARAIPPPSYFSLDTRTRALTALDFWICNCICVQNERRMKKQQNTEVSPPICGDEFNRCARVQVCLLCKQRLLAVVAHFLVCGHVVQELQHWSLITARSVGHSFQDK